MIAKPTLSITIIGHNEAYHLKELLPTLDWADEVIYVDCESQDGSFELAEEQGCRAYRRPNNPNLNVNKAFAMEQAKSEWIFYLDPDERIPDDLKTEILQKIAHPESFRAFTLHRKNFYFGKWLKHGSQYPDTQLRLVRRKYARFPQKHVHERLEIDGRIGHLVNSFEHYPYLNISQYLKKFDFYTTFEANFLFRSGVRPSVKNAWLYWCWIPYSRFFRRFLLKGGFLDGWQGFFAALFDALNFMVRYFKLLEIAQNAET